MSSCCIRSAQTGPEHCCSRRNCQVSREQASRLSGWQDCSSCSRNRMDMVNSTGRAVICRPKASSKWQAPGCCVQAERLAALQHVLTGWMEEVMGGMAGYVPLQAIGQRILGQYSQQQFGDFRGSLLGLLSAYNYESSMLTTARFPPPSPPTSPPVCTLFLANMISMVQVHA